MAKGNHMLGLAGKGPKKVQPTAPAPGLMERLGKWHEGMKQKPGVGGWTMRNKGMALGATAVVAPALIKMLGNLVQQGGDALSGENQLQEEELQREQRRQTMHQQMRMQRLQADTQENVQRIMMMQPEVAQQLMAGRRLPKGAVVLGGQPRMDLLQQMAARMSDPSSGGGGEEGF